MDVVEYERQWVESLNRGDVSAADQVFAPTAVIHINGGPDPNLSVAGFKQLLSGLLAAFPNLQFTIEDQVVSDRKVALRWVATGTHSAALGEVPATGRTVRINGIILDHVQDGRVLERWEQWDQMGLLQQLGLA